MKSLGERVRELRKESNLTQAELAMELGTFEKESTGRTMISMLERGEWEPGEDFIRKLEIYFDEGLDGAVEVSDGGETIHTPIDEYNAQKATERVLKVAEEDKPRSTYGLAHKAQYPVAVVREVLDREGIDLHEDYFYNRTDLGSVLAAEIQEDVGDIQKIYEENKQVIEMRQEEEQDFLHSVEFMELDKLEELYDTLVVEDFEDNFDKLVELLSSDEVKHGLYTLIELSKSRKERRSAKTQNRVLKPLYDALSKFKGLKSEMRSAQGEADNQLQSVQAMGYKPKSGRYDLFPDIDPPTAEDLAEKFND